MDKLQIQDAFIRSFDTLVNAKLKDAKNVLTIEVFIDSIIDESLNLYKAKYYDEFIEVYGSDDSRYNINDKVTVLVPEGDFTKDKFIVGYVPNVDANADDKPKNKVVYNNILNIYQNIDGHNLTSSKNEDITDIEGEDDFQKNSSIDDNIEFSQIFGELINNVHNKVGVTNVIGITATFNINIDETRSGVPANHGIKFTLPVIKNNENDFLTLGFTAIDEENNNEEDNLILGNPYKLTDYTQTVYFLLPEDTKYDYTKNKDIKIHYFCKGYAEGGNENDISITNINISVYERIDFSKITDKYYLSIDPQSTNYFSGSYNTPKTLTPKLYINGELSPISNEWSYNWYLIDYSQEKGKRDLGNGDTLSVKLEDVPYISTYGCTISKNDKGYAFSVTGEIDLYRLNSEYDLTLIKEGSFTKKSDVEEFNLLGKCIKTTSFDNDVKFYWGYSNSVSLELNNALTNKSIKINDKEFSISEILKSHYVDDGCVIHLTAYEGDKFIGTTKLFLVVEESQKGKYSIIVSHEPAIHKYNADGSSPYMQDFSTQYVNNIYGIKDISFTIVQNTEYGAYEISDEFYNRCQVTWILPNHNKSLMDFTDSIGNDYSLDENDDYVLEKYGKSSIKYTIDGIYDLNKSILSNNTIKLIVNINNEETYTEYIKTNFLKDGQLELMVLLSMLKLLGWIYHMKLFIKEINIILMLNLLY